MFCVYNINKTNFKQLILIAEYKILYKFSINDIQLGLWEMDLDQITVADIDRDLTNVERIVRICCQYIRALVTQAFVYMISQGF